MWRICTGGRGSRPDSRRGSWVKYLSNVIEADHGKLNLLIGPIRGFKTMRTAYATVKLVFDSISGSAAARIQQNHDLRR